MNPNIKAIIDQSGISYRLDPDSGVMEFNGGVIEELEYLVELAINSVLVEQMKHPLYVAAMDSYYEKRFAHRFD